MRKDTIRSIVMATILLAVYHLIAFLIPFAHTAAFWVSYGFSLASFAVVAASMYIAFVQNPDAKSRFYGFPIAKIGVSYGVAQLIAGIAVMAMGKWIPWWIAVLVYAIGLGIAVVGLISAETVVNEIKAQDEKLKKDVTLMRSLQSKVNQMATQCDIDEVKKVAEEIRYSDPVSCDASCDAEQELSVLIDELQAAVVDGEEKTIRQLCRKASAALAERNRLCKLNKR